MIDRVFTYYSCVLGIPFPEGRVQAVAGAFGPAPPFAVENDSQRSGREEVGKTKIQRFNIR
jgi:hypothetical protein